MAQNDTTTILFQRLPTLASKYQQMEKTFEKIDKLEYMVARIKEDMDKLDKQLTEAEATIEGGPLKAIMPMIFVSIVYDESIQTQFSLLDILPIFCRDKDSLQQMQCLDQLRLLLVS